MAIIVSGLIAFATLSQIALAADSKADIADYFKLYYEQQVLTAPAATVLEFLHDAAAAHQDSDQVLKPGAARAVIVDRRNGYLQIDDSSNTDQILTMALYRKADGSALIVVGTSDCADACDFTAQFFMPAGGDLKAVPRARVVPEIAPAQFIKPGRPMPKGLAEIEPKINYVPARIGTALTLKPWYGYEAEEQMDAATRSSIQDVELRWDRRKGIFAAIPPQ